MKKIAVMILLIPLLFGFSTLPEGCLPWQNSYHLTWSNFKGTPGGRNIGHSANTANSIYYFVMPKRDSFEIEVKACFNEGMSWYVARDTNVFLLLHEQRHWDITEVYARKFRKYAANWDKKYLLNDYLRNGMALFEDSLAKMQVTYDRETNHSLNAQKQELWNRKIDSLLKSYDAFAIHSVKVRK